MAPSSVIDAINVVLFLPRQVRGTLPWALRPLGTLARERVMEVCVPPRVDGLGSLAEGAPLLLVALSR